MRVDNLNYTNQLGITSTFQAKNYSTFGQTFKNFLAEANQLQHQADQADMDLSLGKADSIHSVMIAAAKAKISLELTTAITTKCVDAYQEIMSMQV